MKIRNVVLLIVGVIVVAAVFSDKEPETGSQVDVGAKAVPVTNNSAPSATQSSASTPVPAQEQPLKKLDYPTQQAGFNAIIDKYRTEFINAKNEMSAGAQRPKRRKEICTVLKGLAVKDWVGFIKELSSNGDGYGVLTVDIGADASVGTWNNSLSDTETRTLIKPDSPILEQVMQMSEGQAVKFSGTFFSSETDCAQEQSLTLSGAMKDPEFVFRFTKVETIGPLVK